MSALLWVAVGFASAGILGAWLRWAAAPVIVAFRAGRALGRNR